MTKNKTSVEWLEQQIIDLIPNDIGSQLKFKNKIIKAKQMEKEQHDLTFARGSMTGYANANGYESVDFEQYYSETYKQQDNDTNPK